MRVVLRLLLLTCLSAQLVAGNRVLQIRDRWALSNYEKTAIARAGYDYAPTILVEGASYRMWWCGSAPTGNPYVDHMWTADSSDGLNWTRFRVASPPAPLGLICDPSVVHVGGLYFMYFTGTTDAVNGTNNQIYLAVSQDGEVWSKYPTDQRPQPVVALPAATSGYGIGQPSVVFVNNRFWLYYTDTTREGGGTFLASSIDGLNFQPENGGHRLLATNSVDVKYSTTLGLFLMVHGSSHDKLLVSSSADGIQWDATAADRYLALAPSKNKAFEGGLLGSSTGTMGNWTLYYFASHQGTPGVVQDPLSWDIDIGRLSLSVLPPPGTVYQYVSPAVASMDHVYDTRVATPPLYDFELRAFAVQTATGTGLTPFFRLYHPGIRDHFYTADLVEKAYSMSLGYVDEGILGYVSKAPLAGTLPLYRLYHARGDHFYTVDAAERDRRKSAGFQDEGVAAHVWPADRNGQPPPPRVAATLFATPPFVSIEYDASNVAGAVDIRVEISGPNQGFQFSNPAISDPLARISQRVMGNSGSLRILTDALPAGRYQVRLAALEEAGLPLGRYSDSRSFQIGAPAPVDNPPFGFIDSPVEGSSANGPLNVEGWALDDQAVARIEVFVDGLSVGVATGGRPRPDVRQVFPSYPNAETSGYRLETNISQLATGPHLILVELTDTAGQKVLIGPRIAHLIDGGNLAPFGFVDLPDAGAVPVGNLLPVAGWALDDRGVLRVELWVDGVQVGLAPHGFLRPDVAAVFPGYPNTVYSGFYTLLNTSGLALGQHLLTVRIIDNQGLPTELPPRAFVK